MSSKDRSTKRLTVGIIGTRGIPNSYGGFERFVEVLVADYAWQQRGVNLVVYGEKDGGSVNAWTTVKAVGLQKNSNPLSYYAKSLFLAVRDCDVVICCGVGISYLSFWARISRVPLIINPDGCEWRRTKWSPLGRVAIKAMYMPTLVAAKKIVLDSRSLSSDFGERFSSKYSHIGYQAPKPRIHPLSEEVRETYGLAMPYILVVARLEPENNVRIAIDAYQQAQVENLQLIIIGGKSTKHYLDTLAAYESESIRFLGAIYDEHTLHQIRGGCSAYIHGHSVGGTNPSLLEALALVQGQLYCHDNKYNREAASDQAVYFDESSQLAKELKQLDLSISSGQWKPRVPTRDSRFEPSEISRLYAHVIEEVSS